MNGERLSAIVAVHLLLLRDDSVLLLRRANTGYGDGSYSVPAGHLEVDEAVRAACVREAAEETGVEIEQADLAFALVMHRRAESERIDFFFTTRRWQGTPRNAEPHKCDDLRWSAVVDLPPTTNPYIRHAIEQWAAGHNFAEFGWE